MSTLLNVGITGQAGFMGQHLFNFLGTKPEEVSCIAFKRSFFEAPKLLAQWVSQCDVIVHIAALNRHEDQQVIYNTNVDLVKALITACEAAKVNPKIIFSSSTQEQRDNLYGKSKRDGRALLEAWASTHKTGVTSLVIPNVFGPFGKPFYNSFIATFCHQLNHNEQPQVHQDSEVSLIYINELLEVFYTAITAPQRSTETIHVEATAHKKVTEILELLNHFKETYVVKGEVPNITNSFNLNLFNTFTSFIPKDYFPRPFVKHTDNRGAFVEIMRAGSSGQSSYSTTVPGITRGNHYHTRKVERFAVIQGKASIKWRKINTDKVYEFMLDGNEPAYVDMPIWYTHNITNIGDTELVTLFWINEPYNPDDPDTFFESVD